ncbi:MAG: hypothetical protein KA981_02935 [Bacteroidia bacterium]|jgi:hypothetical protein|nr:hypothetical protein [Bacteroidia bacterium]
MNQIRRVLGMVWAILGPTAIYLMIAQALKKVAEADVKIGKAVDETARVFAEAAKLNIEMQWGIIIIIFVPIAFGLMIFGYYSFKGEYDRE